MFKHLFTASSVTLLALSLIVPGLDPSAENEDWLPDIVDSSRLESPTVASGHIVDREGRPFPGSVQVELRLWPGESVLANLEVGDGVKVTPVAKAVTDARGFFELRIENPGLVQRMAADSQYVDLEIVAETPDGRAPYSFSLSVAELEGKQALDSDEGLATHGPLANLTIEPISAEDYKVSDASSQGIPAGAVDDPSTDGSDGYGGKLYCEWVVVENLGSRAVTVGAAYLTASGVTHDFQFSSGATMTVGVGYSATSQDAGFSQAGTSTRGTSATVDYPTHTGTNNHRIFRTYYKYSTFRERCQTSATSGWYWANNWETRPTTWAAGAPYGTSASAPSTPSAYCTGYTPGTSHVQETTAAASWSTGVDVSYYIGINLSSQSGWTAYVKNTFTFNATRDLCGTNGTPGGSPKRLVVRP